MRVHFKSLIQLFKQTAKEWSEDKAPRLGAALAYYTIFSISPLFIIVIAIAGFWFGEEAARNQIFQQLSGLVGEQGAQAIQSMILSARKPEQGTVATIVAVITLLLGATGVFVQLQDALNAIWNVEPKPRGGIWNFIRGRLLSFAMVLGIGFLLLVSLILSAAITAAGTYMSGLIPGAAALWQATNFLVSFGAITVLFAMIFKIMPDVKVAWRDVWIGAVLTALLFSVGKLGLGMYLAKSTVASAYGAAGSLVVVLIWVYYSAQILFFGAEFTQVYAMAYGSRRTTENRKASERATAPHFAGELGKAVPRPAPPAFPAAAFHPTRRDLGFAALFLAVCATAARFMNRNRRWS